MRLISQQFARNLHSVTHTLCWTRKCIPFLCRTAKMDANNTLASRPATGFEIRQLILATIRQLILATIRQLILAITSPFATKFREILGLNESAIQEEPGRKYQSQRGWNMKLFTRLCLRQYQFYGHLIPNSYKRYAFTDGFQRREFKKHFMLNFVMFWDVTQSRLISHRRFGTKYQYYLQGSICPSWSSWPSKMVPIRGPETSERNQPSYITSKKTTEFR